MTIAHKKHMEDTQMSAKKSMKFPVILGAGGICAALVGLYLVLNTYVIGAHEIGVVVDEGVIERVARPGWHFTALLEDIVTIPTVPQQRQVKGLSMATKDNFAMTGSTIGFTFRVPADKALQLYHEHPDYEGQLQVLIAKSAKNTVGAYNLIAVPQNRAEIEQKIRSQVNSFVESQLGLSGMVTNVSLAYYGWEQQARKFLASVQQSQQQIRLAKLDSKRDAIVRKSRAEEAAMKAKNKLIAARSEKKAQILRAEGQAKSERLMSAAMLEKIQSMVDVLGKERAVAVIRWRNWNGQMPQVISGGQGLSLERPIQLRQ